MPPSLMDDTNGKGRSNYHVSVSAILHRRQWRKPGTETTAGKLLPSRRGTDEASGCSSMTCICRGERRVCKEGGDTRWRRVGVVVACSSCLYLILDFREQCVLRRRGNGLEPSPPLRCWPCPCMPAMSSRVIGRRNTQFPRLVISVSCSAAAPL